MSLNYYQKRKSKPEPVSQAKNSDPRTPVDVSQVGKFTVRIYDMTAYKAHLRQFYGSESAS